MECASARSVSGNINTKFMRLSFAARGDEAAEDATMPAVNNAARIFSIGHTVTMSLISGRRQGERNSADNSNIALVSSVLAGLAVAINESQAPVGQRDRLRGAR